MSECKHGLRHGCSYCHARPTPTRGPSTPKRVSRATRLAEQMNDRLTVLKRRLRKLRGE
jgi:DNA repair photolyase